MRWATVYTKHRGKPAKTPGRGTHLLAHRRGAPRRRQTARRTAAVSRERGRFAQSPAASPAGRTADSVLPARRCRGVEGGGGPPRRDLDHRSTRAHECTGAVGGHDAAVGGPESRHPPALQTRLVELGSTDLAASTLSGTQSRAPHLAVLLGSNTLCALAGTARDRG